MGRPVEPSPQYSELHAGAKEFLVGARRQNSQGRLEMPCCAAWSFSWEKGTKVPFPQEELWQLVQDAAIAALMPLHPIEVPPL